MSKLAARSTASGSSGGAVSGGGVSGGGGGTLAEQRAQMLLASGKETLSE